MCLSPIYLSGYTGLYVVPCGKCPECKKIHAVEWSYRIMLEASQYKNNCFVSLTYADEFLPEDKSVNRTHLQLFIKRLRERLRPTKIRLFYSGEYGDLYGRPHYHIILFNYFPDDAYFFKKSPRGNEMYRSPLIESCWRFGFSSIEKLENMSQAQYLSLYLQKLPTDGRKKPFVGMSNRPGIGFNAISDSVAVDGNIYKDGKYIRAPRYFREKLKERGFNLSRPAFRLKSLSHVDEYLKQLKSRNERFYSRFPALRKRFNKNIYRPISYYRLFLPPYYENFFKNY